MKVAVMQPYFFPYIGYFQLMDRVDKFVIFDDVQYMDRGWVNRNRIRVNNSAKWLTMPVQKAPRKNLINQRNYVVEAETTRKILRKIEASYQKKEHFATILPLIVDCLGYSDSNVAKFNANLLEKIASELGIECEVYFSSCVSGGAVARGQSKIIEICKTVNGDSYLNLEGGQSLYDAASFRQCGISLSFVKCKVCPPNLVEGPVHLSIIDTLMCKGILGAARELAECETLEAE